MTSQPPKKNVLLKVSGSLAALILERRLAQGKEISIPSLGLTIKKTRVAGKRRNKEMMGHRTKLIDGDEYDALTRWRHVCPWKPGQRRRIKRRHNKRQRRLARKGLNTYSLEYWEKELDEL